MSGIRLRILYLKCVRNKILIAITLSAFAGNSVLCRMALGGELIDPTSFATLRIIGGVVMLFIFTRFLPQRENVPSGQWRSAIALYIYAVCFAFAYVSLPSGTGALILFGVVQLVMLVMGYIKGERMSVGQWGGFVIALSGLVYLLSPGLAAPDLKGAGLMTVSGLAWAFYTLAGKGNSSPVIMTRGNFLKAAPFALGMSIILWPRVDYRMTGVILALVSGALTSGLAYTLWYLILPKLSTTHAALLQLLVPLIATLGGVLLLAEELSLRIVISALLILGGLMFSMKRRATRESSCKSN